MTAETDAVLSRQTHIKDDHILVDLKLENDLNGRLSGDVSFSRSTIGTFVDNGIVKTASIDIARFETNGLLNEGFSENLALPSEEFDNATWLKQQTTITPDTIVGPDLNSTADKLVEDSSDAIHRVRQSITVPLGVEITMSVLEKKGERDFIALAAPAALRGKFFDLSNGIIGSDLFSSPNNAEITTLDNGWFRCSITFTTTNISEFILVYVSTGDTVTSYQGDGASGVFIWGGDVEVLPFVSSYIKTTTTSVTRDADILSIPNQNIPSPIGQYTISLDQDILGLDSSKTFTVYSVDGETSRKIEINTTTGKVEATHGGVTSTSTTVLTPGTPVKIDFSVDDINQTLYIDNVQEAQSTKGTVTGIATGISIGNADGSDQIYGHTKNFKIYDIGLTASQVVDPDLAIEFISVDFDISFDTDGDILTDDFFDTSLLYSLLGERRADPSEVVEPQLRRGWIGSEDKDFENGSKLWLFEQARVTRSNLNRIEDEARKALQWLVDDGLVVSVDEVTATVKSGKITLEIVIRRSRSKVERRFFDLWENTGLRLNA